MKKKKALGRGLSSFISEDEFINSGENNIKTDQLYLPIEYIKPNPDQPRKFFDTDELKELASTINQKGILQPLIVTQKNNNYYEIVAGERRWRAAQLAQIHEIPVIIKTLSDKEIIEIAIIENVQRKDLNAIEEAESYKNLIDNFNYDHDRVAQFIGKSRSYISNCLRLLLLPEKLIEMIRNNKISQGHAKVLIGLENALLLADKIIKKKLSVRQLESLVRLFKNNTNKSSMSKDINIIATENDLSQKIGMRVFVHNKKNNSGTLSINYKGIDQLDRLIDVIKKHY